MMIADTDVLIDTLHGKGAVVDRMRIEIETGRLATTAVTAFELLSGARRKGALRPVEDLLGALTVLPVDERASREAAAVRRELEQRGEGLAMADYLIAGVCLTRSGVLLTRNRKHFERVPGLALGTMG